MPEEKQSYQDNEELKLSYFNDKVFPIVFSSVTAAYTNLSQVYKGNKFSKGQTDAFKKLCRKYLNLKKEEESVRRITVLGFNEKLDFSATKRKDRAGKYLPWIAYIIADEVTRAARAGSLKDNCYEIKRKELPVLLGFANDRQLDMKDEDFPLLMYGIKKEIAVNMVKNIRYMFGASKRLNSAVNKINKSFEGIRVEAVLYLLKVVVVNGRTKTVSVKATEEEIAKLEQSKDAVLEYFNITQENEAYSKKIGIANFYKQVDEKFYEGTSITGRFIKYFVYIDEEAVKYGRYLLNDEAKNSYKIKVNENILNPEDSLENQNRFVERFIPCRHSKKTKRVRFCLQECCLFASEDEHHLQEVKKSSILYEYLFNLDKAKVDNLIADARKRVGLA